MPKRRMYGNDITGNRGQDWRLLHAVQAGNGACGTAALHRTKSERYRLIRRDYRSCRDPITTKLGIPMSWNKTTGEVILGKTP
ncbi:hypothetical protein AK95_20900 [Paenibacillus sp. LC231]|nr:hypothetical protein AK95_20900 [Paenibacillus sp. LC231]